MVLEVAREFHTRGIGCKPIVSLWAWLRLGSSSCFVSRCACEKVFLFGLGLQAHELQIPFACRHSGRCQVRVTTKSTCVHDPLWRRNLASQGWQSSTVTPRPADRQIPPSTSSLPRSPCPWRSRGPEELGARRRLQPPRLPVKLVPARASNLRRGDRRLGCDALPQRAKAAARERPQSWPHSSPPSGRASLRYDLQPCCRPGFRPRPTSRRRAEWIRPLSQRRQGCSPGSVLRRADERYLISLQARPTNQGTNFEAPLT